MRWGRGASAEYKLTGWGYASVFRRISLLFTPSLLQVEKTMAKNSDCAPTILSRTESVGLAVSALCKLPPTIR